MAHQFEVVDGIATVTLDRPEARNSLNRQALTELTETFGRLADDDSVNVVGADGVRPGFLCRVGPEGAR